MNPYRNLLAMLLASFVIMYLVMFLNVDDVSHVYLSLTRLYMSLLMVTPMAVLMVTRMKNMYTDKKRNNLVYILSFGVFLASFFCLRTQAFISDAQYMKAMIPHHSSAIMTSRNASIKDQEVRVLADSIIRSQREEIGRMKRMLESR